MIEIIFWLSAGTIVYTYIGFPILVWIISRIRARPHAVGPVEPRVSMVIAAFNEERVIREKLENTLALDYADLEVVLAADGSTDATVAIGEEFSDRGVRVLHEPGRKGKTSALNRASEHCTGEILFFSDANTVYPKDVIRNLVRNFADPAVGGVSGRKIILEHGERAATEGETAFWSYESFLKTGESRIGSIATADGEIFALRKDLFDKIPPHVVHDDMYLTLDLVKKGYRVVYDNDATSGEQASKNLHDEFHLKVRYASAGYQIISEFRRMLVPPTDFFAFQFLSHKLLRWLAPVFLILVFASSFFAAGQFYRGFFWLQTAFYATALVALILPARARPAPLYFPLYFTMGNAAGLYGLFKYFLVGQSTQWRRAER